MTRARSLVLLVSVISVMLAAPGTTAAFRGAPAGAVAPTVVLTVEGRNVAVPAAGRVTVALFWRPGQSFSDDALADLSALAPVVLAKGAALVAIAESGATRPAPAPLRFDVVTDHERRAADAFGVIVFPSTAVIDARGVLRAYVPSRRSNYRAVVEAHVLHALGDISEAELGRRLTAAGEIVGGRAEAAQAALKRAAAAAADRKHDEAVVELAQAIALEPGLVEAHLQLGYIRLDANEPRQALSEFESVLARHPGSPGARVGAGIARVRLGQVDDGIRQIEEAVVLNPEPVRGHYELGRAYETRGDVTRAAHHYRWAFLKLLQGRK